MGNLTRIGVVVSTTVVLLSGCSTHPARAHYGSSDQQTLRDRCQAEVDAHHYTLTTWPVADGPSNSTFTDVSFLQFEDLRLYLSASCLQPSGKLDCAALDGLLAVPGKSFFLGNGSPAGAYCGPVGGQMVSNPQNSAGYCRFSDGSIIEEWSLVYTPNIVLGEPAS